MDVDALLIADRVQNNIQLGESHIREFKSALEGRPGQKKARPVREILREIGEQLVGFANADGGDLLIGVEDDGTVTGVPHDETDLRSLLDAPATHVYSGQTLPMLSATPVILENERVLFFSVSKGTNQIYQLPDGRCMRRFEKECRPVSFDAVMFDRQEARSRGFERQFVDGAGVHDLDLEELQVAANSYMRGLSVERYLQQTGLSEYSPGGLQLRMAALLLFAKDVRKWHARSQVRILRVIGNELGAGSRYNVKEDITEEGNIFKLLVRAWDLLRTTFLVQRTQFADGAKFETRLAYPEEACREALINALAHRDYSVQSGVEIFVFNDRMEVRSPGTLLSTISVDHLQDLKGAHESRNPLIARLLREHRYMRELGEGIRRIFEAMELNDLEKPRLVSGGGSFSVVFSNKTVFTPKEEEWLGLFNGLTLTRLQKRIVAAGRDGKELSPDVIYHAMNTEDRDTYDREVTGLRKAGVLVESRTSSAAQQIARVRGLEKSAVPRFRVRNPSMAPRGRGEPRPIPAIAEPRRDLFPEDTGVFVGNVEPSTTEDELRATFQRFGTVRRITVRPDNRPGLLSNYSVVWFGSAEEAAKAIEGVYGFSLNGRNLTAQRFRAKRPRAFGKRAGK